MKNEIFILALRTLLVFLLFIAVQYLLDKINLGAIRRFDYIVSAVVAPALGETFFTCFKNMGHKKERARLS